MTCGGCSGAVDRVLKKLEGMLLPPLPFATALDTTNAAIVGVESYEVSLENQNAKVVTSLPYETVLAKIAKTGKKITSATADGVAQPIEVPAAA